MRYNTYSHFFFWQSGLYLASILTHTLFIHMDSQLVLLPEGSTLIHCNSVTLTISKKPSWRHSTIFIASFSQWKTLGRAVMMQHNNMQDSSCILCLSPIISDEKSMSTLLLCTISRPMSCSSCSPISADQSISLTKINFSCLEWETPYAHSDAFLKREESVFFNNNTVSLCYQTAPC